MSAYMVPSLRLTLNEIIIAIWFSVLGIELRDVAHFMAYRLNRPPRTEPAIFNHMDRINNGQLQRGCPALCTPGMADWDKAAVHDYLIRLTDDANLLANLLWFDNRHLPLLEEYEGIPTHEIVDVRGMQRELNDLLQKHHIYWRSRSLYGRRNYY